MLLKYQQGDVLLFNVEEMPDKLNMVSINICCVAEGELTGHSHVAMGECELLENIEKTRKFLRVKSQVKLTHQEHKQQIINPGMYEIKQVREIDPFNEEIHKVKD